MGSAGDSSRGEADCREPSLPAAVRGGSDGLHRRPAQAGASTDSEARYEAPPNGTPNHLRPCPENASVVGNGAHAGEAAPAARFGGVPSPSHDKAPEDHQGERRSVDAGCAPAKRGRGRRSQKWVVRVKAIDPEKYPEHLRNPRHPFACMKPEDRMEDIITFCARLWVRTCQDTARQFHLAKQEDEQVRAKAA